jgi:hypothetical protein
MQTRSQTNYEKNTLYEVEIDFEEASILWKANKSILGNGTYKYVCKNMCTSGKRCIKKCITGQDYCSVHIKKYS